MGETIISAEKMSVDAFSYMCSGKAGDVFDLETLTGSKEFYYGDDLQNLTKCTQVVLQKNGESCVLVPLDTNGNPVNVNVYMVYDHLYSFDIPLNNIVDEHSEDNGDVYLWNGTEYYVTNHLQPTEEDTKETIDAKLTEIHPYTVRITGHIGDTFISSELDELLIYAATGEKRAFRSDRWTNLKYVPSDNGQRYYQGYCINNYIKLNSFEDKVNYFDIYTKDDGTVALGVVLPGNQFYSMEDVDFYTLRESVVKPTLKNDKDVYHVQLRVPSNIMLEKDGELYDGDFTLKGGSAVVKYKGTELVNDDFVPENKQSGISQQETNTLEWTPALQFDEEGSDLFDAEKMQITITFEVYGTLTAASGKEIVYTKEEPLSVTETLTSEKLIQSYYACPNQRGYDVLLDLVEAVKNDVDNESKVSVTKIWDDSSDYYGVRPDHVTVTLERSVDGGETWSEFEGNVVTITGEGQNAGKSIWTKEITGIETFTINAVGEVVPYQFQIKSEDSIALDREEFAYEPSVDGMVVTNKLRLETETNISVEKKWIDEDGEEMTAGEIPESIYFSIYQDGKYYTTGILSKSVEWKTEIAGLPVYKSAQNKYTYTCYELDENGKKIQNGGIVSFDGEYYESAVTENDGAFVIQITTTG